MKQTAMQELIDFIKTKRYNTNGVTLCEQKAQQLLEKEKQQIIEAVEYDSQERKEIGMLIGEQYYNQTFKICHK